MGPNIGGARRAARGLWSRRAGWLAGIAVLALGAGAAQAQEADVEVEGVTVTAQRRAQDTLDVGLAVTAVGADQLQSRRVEQVTDIAAFAPNIDIKENMPGILPVITIRGVGLNDFSATNNPSAGVYVDEVYLSSLALMNFDLFDLERMEALKGPQGTLYGRNSTAGALNIITAKPSFGGFEARIGGSYGDYQAADLEGMVNLPVSDRFALRISAKAIRQDEGYWFNRVTNTDIGRRDVAMARLQARFKPTDDLDILVKLEGQRARSQTGYPEFFGQFGGAGCPGKPTCTDLFGYSDPDGDPFKGDWSGKPDYDINQFAATARVEWNLGWASLTSVTGYIDFDRSWGPDTDAGPRRQVDFIEKDNIAQLSQELRLAGSTDRLEWLVGGFYSRDTVQVTYDGALQDLFNTTTLSTGDQTTKSAALFANGEWKLADSLSLVTGLRYTWEQKHNAGGTFDLNTGCPVSGLSGAPCGTPAIPLAYLDATISDRNWSWKLGLNWKPAERTLVYGTISQGVKSGGFFTGVATSNAQLLPYEPETLLAYEVGVKQRLRAAGLQWSAAAFYYDYSDVQTFIRDTSGGLPIQRLGNVKDASIYGLDADLAWNPEALKGLTLNAGLGLLHTELGSFVSNNGPVAKGNELPDAPKLSFNLGAAYEVPVSDRLALRFQVDGRYSGETFKDAINDPIIAADSFWVWNARASLFSGDDWDVSIWGKNLADERYVTQGVNQGPLGFGFRVYGPPRTWGVSFSKRFQ